MTRLLDDLADQTPVLVQDLASLSSAAGREIRMMMRLPLIIRRPKIRMKTTCRRGLTRPKHLAGGPLGLLKGLVGLRSAMIRTATGPLPRRPLLAAQVPVQLRMPARIILATQNLNRVIRTTRSAGGAGQRAGIAERLGITG